MNQAECTRQAMEALGTAMKIAVELQARCTGVIKRLESPANWQEKRPGLIAEMLLTMQRDIAESARQMSEEGRKAMSLFQHPGSSDEESQSEWGQEVNGWIREIVSDATNAHAQRILDVGAQSIASWGELAKDLSDRVEAFRQEVERATERALEQK